MILTSFDKGKEYVVVYIVDARTGDACGDLFFEPAYPSYSTADLVIREPKTNHKKNLRGFTDQLNERDRKRRWRK